MNYDHQNIEKKWQKRWMDSGIFEAQDDSEKEKYYLLVEFPYPSGAGLHIGHPRSYTALDIIARKKRMEGKNVLYPIGWDAFGLPTENYAIKTGRKPQDVTKENTDTFRRQLQSIGFSFDWSREINTTDPEYYKWTQWMFLQFYKQGLAYKNKMPINWCVDCKIGLANEEVVNGVCERCGGEVEKRDKEQWMIAITKYAERLLSDLDTVDYLPKIKKQQQDWIGKSEGAEVDFKLSESDDAIKVFTTRPDTLFGATYMVLAPEHELVSKITIEAQKSDVEAYVSKAGKKTDIERGDATKVKTGVFTGAYAINPVNNKKIPVWVADYVMMGYGTGAIMAVPGHDSRDNDFILAMNVKFAFDEGIPRIEWIPVVAPPLYTKEEISRIKEVYSGDGLVINSDFLNDLSTAEAKKKIILWLEEGKFGKATVNYRLRDWVFSRQRYWGEPIPLVYCEKCASTSSAPDGGWVPVADEDLPVELPDVEKYEPTDTGESPLSAIDDWVNTTCPKCSGPAKRETDTMPNWAGSSWYFLRYIDPDNKKAFADQLKIKNWMPIDLYNGGMEHTTLHLLYSRFWHKFLFDQGFVSTPEPYARRHSHGLILAEDGHKMSKSKGNTVNPDEIVEKFGADALRVYEMFIGSFEEPVPWSMNGLVGAKRFLDKVVRLSDWLLTSLDVTGDSFKMKDPDKIFISLNQTIKKVTEDIENMRFNTAVAQMMIFVNEAQDVGFISKESFMKFLQILCPFAPHLTNELAERLGQKEFIEVGNWPEFDSTYLVDSEIKIAVQINGKRRGEVVCAPDALQEKVEELARADENIAKYLEGDIKKIIYIGDRLINFVI